ncbi:unnamed protein product, partial [marine sediment metagenome]
EANATMLFAFSDDWETAFETVNPIAYDVGFYPHDVYLSSYNASASVGTSVWLGEITIGTTNLVPGVYEVVIDNAFDGISTLGLGIEGEQGDPQFEPLSGKGTFTVIPEPASLLLLYGGISLLCLARRARRRSSGTVPLHL